MAGIRRAISEGALDAFAAEFHRQRAEGDIDPL